MPFFLSTILVLVAAPGPEAGRLMAFTASWCAPCRTMQPILERLRGEGLAIEIIDIERDPERARRFSVSAVPTFVLLDGDRARTRLVGARSEAELRGLLSPKSRVQSPEQGKPSSSSRPSTLDPRLASVHVIVFEASSQWHGSGTSIWSDGRHAIVVTAAHVVSRAGPGRGRVLVIFPDRLRCWAKVKHASAARDIAVLLIQPNRSVPVASLAQASPPPGSPVLSIGYPGGGAQQTLRGRILSLGRWSGYTEASLRAAEGHSGGGLFYEGRLVGVLWGSDGTSLSVSLADVRRALDAAGYGFVLGTPTTSRRFGRAA